MKRIKNHKRGMLNCYKLGVVATAVAITLGGGVFQKAQAYNIETNNYKISKIQNQTINKDNTIVNLAIKGVASTSYCSSWEDVTAINDGFDPTSSSDRAHKVYGNWDNPGTSQWVEYDFSDKYTISSSDVYWFDDNQGIDLPTSCSIQYWNGTSWVNVSDAKGLGVEENKYNKTTFKSIITKKIRLNMKAKAGYSTGVLEWKVYGEKSQGGDPTDNTKNPSKRELTQTPSWADPFYKKCVYSYNIPILSSDNVSDAALFKAYDILDVMLRKIAVDYPEILQNMIKNNTRVDIVGLTEHNVDLPEWRDWPNKTERRAGGGIDTTICENELIMTPNDPNPGDPDVYYLTQFNVLSHEFTHTILMSGIGDADHQGAAPEIYKKIVAAYNNALAKDLYKESDYDRTNYHEYFAGQVPRWFNCNPTDLNVPNASSKTDKEQLKEYDPEIYSVIKDLFGDYKMPEPWNK
ncbi:hypothetical protein NNC19_02330 [Clostridium sp. SHJSY1]|uniref:hypothetical protein n=1 Tax=Clostridium sp. SHJSY1 TaxID=2942483 RepID=UPI002875478A|nr:hypothetical protein [Clostridium sp. SHJSY1]MDS0524497.1 hypothetical protein [Clostridium sp. SHJSY1]